MGIFSSIGKAVGAVASAAGFPEFGALASGSSFLSGLDSASTGFGDLLGAGATYLGGVQANNANAAIAQKQMDFQERMRKTSYQTAVQDLQAAGLNPMLAYSNGGASVPSGASAVMQNAAGAAVSTALQSKMTAAQVENMSAQNAQIKAQTAQALTQSKLNQAQTVKAVADAGVSSAASANMAVDNALKKLTIPKAQNESNFQKTWWGRNVSPVLPNISGATSSAGSIANIFK